MIVLGIDTCLGACSAAVLDGERLLSARSEPMWRGHQERIASMVAEVMAEAGVPYAAIGKVGATVGPGSFTGLRVGVAFAKGLAVALGIPAAGIGSLEGFALDRSGTAIAVSDARRGQVYWQAFKHGRRVAEPRVDPVEAVAGLYGDAAPDELLGPAAALLAADFRAAKVAASDAPEAAAIARLVAGSSDPLAPLYLRPPDAKLPGGIDPFA